MGNRNSQPEDPDDTATGACLPDSAQTTKIELAHFSSEMVLRILDEIVQSQEEMKLYLKGLTEELCSQSLAFEETYARVEEAQPNDPLEQHNLSMAEFDQLLNVYRNNAKVCEATAKIRQLPSTNGKESENVQTITVDMIVEVHLFMLAQLKSLVQQMQDRDCKEQDYDMKIVAIVVQAIVGAKVQKKFELTSDEIERAMLVHRTELNAHEEFADVNSHIGSIMSRILHGWGRASFMARTGQSFHSPGGG